MKATSLTRVVATMFAAVLTIAIQPSAQSQTYITFDPPGSQGTVPTSINPAGAITGYSRDLNNVAHGFLRSADGVITPFDAPAAGNDLFQGTTPSVITPQGLIVGTYTDENYNGWIFLRDKTGAFTTLQFPTSGSIPIGVTANNEGTIAGEFVDPNGVLHGYLRSPSGTFTVFEFPAAFEMSFFAPNIIGLNAGGTILGSYYDSNFVAHGFLRTPDGTMTSFDAPNVAAYSFFGGTNPGSINDTGTVAGFYSDLNGSLRAFLRASDGTFTIFDTPQPGGFSNGAAINASGVVTGNVGQIVCDSQNICVGTPLSFLRTAGGTISALSDPKAVQGTQTTGINPSGKIIGFYNDENGVSHGFLRNP